MGVMGAGIAKQLSRLYPSVLDADRQYKIPVGSRDRLGHTSHAWVDGVAGRTLVVNLYGQHRYGSGIMTEYDAFKRGLHSIFRRLEQYEEKTGRKLKVGMPFGIGCGYAGGDWNVVFDLIKDAAKQFDREVYLYKLK
jgi:O-acetyl-ADP-ribose deacetylase (regulator of RNase III)